MSLFTLKEEGKDLGLLNRDQTEEWKGWMQIVFLLYHYFHASGVVYKLVRLLISAYLFMTGFGNLSFFYLRRDFGLVRFFQMMWRLCFLSFFLSSVMNLPIIVYYIVPLHTFYFLMCFLVMGLRESLNHTRFGGRGKLLVLGLIIFGVWEFPDVFNIAFGFLSTAKHHGSPVGANGVRYEWQFRSGLDHWSSFLGMVFAMNFPQASAWIRNMDKQPKSKQMLVHGSMLGCFGVIFALWVTQVLVLPKFEYNAIHPYTFIFPMTAYIYVRNLTPRLRGGALMLLVAVGKVTLETYLMQHHIWLTSNAKTVLVMVPGWPKINMIVVSAVYFLVSQRTYKLTISLRAILIPDDPFTAFRWMVNMFGIVGYFTVVAYITCNVVWGPDMEDVVKLLIFSVLCAVHGLGILMVCKNVATKEPVYEGVAGTDEVVDTESNSKSTLSSLKPVMTTRQVLTLCVSTLFTILFLLIFNTQTSQFPVDAPAPPSGAECIPYLTQGGWDLDGPCGDAAKNRAMCIYNEWKWTHKSCSFKYLDADMATSISNRHPLVFVGPVAKKAYIATGMLLSPHTFKYSESDDGTKDSLQFQNIRYSKQWPSETTPNEALVVGLKPGSDLKVAESKVKKHPQTVWLGSQEEQAPASVLLGDVQLNALKVSGITEDVLFDLAAQLVLNGVKVGGPEAYAEEIAVSTNKHNGIAHNPLLGAFTFLVGLVMLLAMDTNLGLGALFKFVFARQPVITWESSVEAIHKSIFKTTEEAP